MTLNLEAQPKLMLYLFVHENIIEGLEERILNWLRLKIIIGLVLCIKKNLLYCISGINCLKQHCSVPLDLEGIKKTDKEIIRSVQRR